MIIRDFEDADWPQVWPIIQEIIKANSFFPYDPDLTESAARATWLEQPPGRTVVAVDGDRVLGTAKMGPNRGGPGAHVSTASFMVAAAARGQGAGTALAESALVWASANGYAAMQFNAVVETNTTAVALYERFGFAVIGTVPRSFDHPVHGRVGLHVMWRELPYHKQ